MENGKKKGFLTLFLRLAFLGLVFKPRAIPEAEMKAVENSRLGLQDAKKNWFGNPKLHWNRGNSKNKKKNFRRKRVTYLFVSTQ